MIKTQHIVIIIICIVTIAAAGCAKDKSNGANPGDFAVSATSNATEKLRNSPADNNAMLAATAPRNNLGDPANSTDLNITNATGIYENTTVDEKNASFNASNDTGSVRAVSRSSSSTSSSGTGDILVSAASPAETTSGSTSNGINAASSVNNSYSSANSSYSHTTTSQIDSAAAADSTAKTSGAVGNLTVDFIDVGQGDAILLEHGDDTMLIDAGEIGKGDDVANFVKKDGITSLDYVVATHPHSDHIGGMSEIIKTFPISHFVDSGYPHTSKTYENMLNSILSKGISFETLKRGDEIEFSPGIEVKVLNPGSSYFEDDLNQNSVVLKVTDGDVSFLLTGDAGIEAENAIMGAGYDVNADILKVGHHGSRTASGASFISAVSPEASIIEVGAGNDYGHPHAETLNLLKSVSTVYRTDYDGTVRVTTDGLTYTVMTEKA